MDVDSAYFDISGECLRDVLKPELLEEFDKEVKNWLETDNIILGRTPALFKPEFIGAKMVALTAKCYSCGESKAASTVVKVSQKAKRHDLEKLYASHSRVSRQSQECRF